MVITAILANPLLYLCAKNFKNMKKISFIKTDSVPELNNNQINQVEQTSIPSISENTSNSQQSGIEKFDVVLKNLNKIIDKLTSIELNSSIPKIWLTEQEAAALLNISRRQVYNMRVNGRIGATCLNGKQMYKIQEINSILEANYTKPFKTK